MITRRGFLKGLGIVSAAPSIVRASSLMKLPPVRQLIIPPPWNPLNWGNMAWKPELTLTTPITRTQTGPLNVRPLAERISGLPLMTRFDLGLEDSGLIVARSATGFASMNNPNQ